MGVGCEGKRERERSGGRGKNGGWGAEEGRSMLSASGGSG